MSKVIDISGKLSREPIFINIGDNLTFKVDDRKNTIMEVLQLVDGSNDPSYMDEVVKKLLGKEAFKQIEALELSLNDYTVIFKALMAIVSGTSYEEFDKRFQNATKEQ